MVWWPGGYDKVAWLGSRTRRGRACEVRVVIDGFLLSGGHRGGVAEPFIVGFVIHLSARETAERDGLIVSSMERLA